MAKRPASGGGGTGRDPRHTKLQIARRQLGMTDDDYRAMLERTTGKRSSKGLTARELGRALAEMERLGFKPKPATGGRGKTWRPKSGRPEIRLIFKLWWLLADAGIARRSRSELNAFICNPKFHAKFSDVPTDVEFLTVERARDVIEALKDLCRRNNVKLELPR